MRRLETFTTLTFLGAFSALLGGCPIWNGDGGPTVTDSGPIPDAGNPDVTPTDTGRPDVGPTDTGPGDTGPQHCHVTGDCDLGHYCNTATDLCVSGATCDGQHPCAAGSFCDARNVCEPGCAATTDCASGQICDTTSHQCIAGGQCSASNPCPSGSTCIDGSCHASDRVCTFAYQCPAGDDCVNGACTPHCTASGNQCIGGQVCVNGHCQDPTTTGSCDTVTCPANQICASGACHPECTTDATCGTGLFCDNGVCRVDNRATVPFCTTANQATTCAANSVCVNGACHISCANPPIVDGGTEDPNLYCQMNDSAFPTCSLFSGQMICLIAGESSPQCTATMPCTVTGQTCINGTCN